MLTHIEQQHLDKKAAFIVLFFLFFSHTEVRHHILPVSSLVIQTCSDLDAAVPPTQTQNFLISRPN